MADAANTLLAQFIQDTTTGCQLDAKAAAKVGLILLIANEIRGLAFVLAFWGVI